MQTPAAFANHTSHARGAVAASVAVFVALAALICVLSYLIYRTQTNEVDREYESHLTERVALLDRDIGVWLKERWGDALTLQGASILGNARDTSPHPPTDLLEARSYLEHVRSSLGYSGISILTSDGRELASAGKTFPTAAAVRAAATTVAANSRRVMLGPRPLEADGVPLVAFIVPIEVPVDFSRKHTGALVLYWNARHVLFDLLQPYPKRSREGLLVRRDGDAVEYLSPRKFDPGLIEQ